MIETKCNIGLRAPFLVNEMYPSYSNVENLIKGSIYEDKKDTTTKKFVTKMKNCYKDFESLYNTISGINIVDYVQVKKDKIELDSEKTIKSLNNGDDMIYYNCPIVLNDEKLMETLRSKATNLEQENEIEF